MSTQKVGFSYPYSRVSPARVMPGTAATVAAPPPSADKFSPSSSVPAPALDSPTPSTHSSPQPAAAPQARQSAPAEVGGWLVAGTTTARAELLATSGAAATGRSLESILAETVARLAPGAPAQKISEVPQQSGKANAKQHPGIELHNHMLGVVNTQYFITNAADGSPRKLLAHISTMFRDDPALQTEAPQLWRMLKNKDVTKMPISSSKKILEQLLTATKHTPFDSVYTPRDELVKRHLHIPNPDMESLIGEVTDDDSAARARLLNGFETPGLPETSHQLVSQASPDELMAKGGLTDVQALQLSHLMVTKRYEIFTADTAVALAKDGVHYSEQSISAKKLLTQLTPTLMSRVNERLDRAGVKTDLRYLAMVNTSHLSENFIQEINPRTGLPSVFEQHGLDITPQQHYKLMGAFQAPGMSQEDALKRIANAAPQDLQEMGGLSAQQAQIVSSGLPPELKRGLQTLLGRSDVMGIDIAAPEKEPFTDRGMKNFDELYGVLKDAAKVRGRELSLRPHVGEGYPEMAAERDNFLRYKALRNDKGEPIHYAKAEDNLETLISHLESRGYSAEKAKQDGVIIRFGHATHATPNQISRMKNLGVVAEANLTSNVETGALQPIKGGGDFFENHSLLNLLYHDVPTVLNTDAQGVMHTTMQHEYQQADRLIGLFKKNKLAMELEDRRVFYCELSPEDKARFDPARLRQWAQDYGDFVKDGDSRDTAR